MTRSEHLAWAKKRALEYLPHKPGEAFSSMCSDLHSHEYLRTHSGIQMGMTLLLLGVLKDPEKVREWIEGFN